VAAKEKPIEIGEKKLLIVGGEDEGAHREYIYP
jgi:hypothetical protein